MAEPFLSDSWYRVKNLKLKLRNHARVRRHRYRGAPWYAVQDDVSGKVHRFTPASYFLVGRLDGNSTVDEIWTRLSEELGEEAPTQDEIVQLLAQLYNADLIQSDVQADVSDLLRRYEKQTQRRIKQNLKNPLSFQLPLFDPDAFLEKTVFLFRPLIGLWGLLLWLTFVLPACFLAMQNWSRLTENLLDRLLSFDSIFLMALCYPFVKALHELGHGYIAKKYGAEVREIGVMFLVFFPVPYVDAGGASGLPNKYQRAAVSAAGILVEVFVACAALYLWLFVEPGIVSSIAYNVMVISGISTVLVNGNILLRFDGYYVFCDLMEVPNLGTRSNKYLSYLTNRYLFGSSDMKPPNATTGEKVLFVLYAPAAFVYRLGIMVGIGIFVATKYLIVGVVIALWSLVLSVFYPSAKGLWHVFTSPQLRRKRIRAVGVTSGTIGALAVLLMAVPAPLHTITQGVVWLPETAYIRAGSEGFIKTVSGINAHTVQQDQALLVLSDPTQATKLRALRYRLQELELKLSSYQGTEPTLAKIAEIERDEARQQLERELDRKRDMIVASPSQGTYYSIRPPEDLPGRLIREGELIGYVLPAHARIVRVVVSQDDTDLVRQKLTSVELKSHYNSKLTFTSKLVRELPAGRYQLPSRALSLAGGGLFATDPSDPDGVKTLHRVFQFDVVVPPDFRGGFFGSRVFVRFSHEWEPLGFQIYRRVRQLFLSQFDV